MSRAGYFARLARQTGVVIRADAGFQPETAGHPETAREAAGGFENIDERAIVPSASVTEGHEEPIRPRPERLALSAASADRSQPLHEAVPATIRVGERRSLGPESPPPAGVTPPLKAPGDHPAGLPPAVAIDRAVDLPTQPTFGEALPSPRTAPVPDPPPAAGLARVLAEARAWVSATPELEDVARASNPPSVNVPVLVEHRAVAGGSGGAPLQELHVSIGTIEVMIDNPTVAGAGPAPELTRASPVPPGGPAPSRRLARHHLRG